MVRLLSLFLIFFLYCGQLWADPVPTDFDTVQANQTLLKINLKLSSEYLNPQHLQNAVTTLTDLRNQASKCVATNQDQLKALKEKITAAGPIVKTPNLVPEHIKYLQNEAARVSKQLDECQLFVLRSSEAIDSYSSTVRRITAEQYFTDQQPIWVNVKKTYQDFIHTDKSELSKNSLSDYTGLDRLPIPVYYGLLAGVFVLFAFGILIKMLIGKPKVDIVSAHRSILYSIHQNLYYFSPWLFLSMGFLLITHLLTPIYGPQELLKALSLGLLCYCGFLMLIDICFSYKRNNRPILALRQELSQSIVNRLNIFALISFAAYIIYVLLHMQPLPIELLYVSRTIIMTLYAINLASLLLLVNKSHRFRKQFKTFRLFLNAMVAIGLVTILCLEWLGFQKLTTFILYATASSIGVLLISWILHKIVMIGFNTVNHVHYAWQFRLRQYLGLMPYSTFTELVWLQAIFSLAIYSTIFLSILRIWVLSPLEFSEFTNKLIYGFTYGNFQIIPSRIFIAAICFLSAIFLMRFLKRTMAKAMTKGRDTGAEQALATIFGYIGFSIVLILALLIAGINLAGLLVVTGALSVGIGFGLQSIVNNFVSGLILLIERPIKHGDRIIVGATEGHVKRISIRSTRITTLSRSDVIVPNAELVSNQVTNLMYHNPNWRVDVPVSVAYDSDVDLVTQLLLDIANEHPDVIKDNDQLKPKVFFKRFADFSLDFELNVIITNVEQKASVLSDLNYAVNKRFKECHIEFPYPQHDVRIKAMPTVAREVMTRSSLAKQEV